MIARPSSDASRCVTAWSTVASGIGSTPLSTPSRPMIARSIVAILPSSKPIRSCSAESSMASADEPGAANVLTVRRVRRSSVRISVPVAR